MPITRTFEVVDTFKRIIATELDDGTMHCSHKKEYEEGVRFTVENVARTECAPVYIDHAQEIKIPFSEEDLSYLLQKFILIERFGSK